MIMIEGWKLASLWNFASNLILIIPNEIETRFLGLTLCLCAIGVDFETKGTRFPISLISEVAFWLVMLFNLQ